MASREEDSFVSEWEYDEVNKEESEIESAEGEEAGRGLTKNQKAWNSCEKAEDRCQLSSALHSTKGCSLLQRFTKRRKGNFRQREKNNS